MAHNDLDSYRWWLLCKERADKTAERDFVLQSFTDELVSSSAYQEDALVNGKSQPMAATRKSTKKCNVTLDPSGDIHIGDLVYVFNEYWICVELYIDEYAMKRGVLWMCNQVFHYQDHNLNEISKYAILDDGSYTSGNDKPILVTDNSFRCYISLDEESRALFVDKRLAIGVIYDSSGKAILEVGKIKWIDVKSRNFGEGSHLMLFGINDDAYNPETDDLEKLICDYRATADDQEAPEPGDTAVGTIVIDGRTSIRIGSGRTYTAKLIGVDGATLQAPEDLLWEILPETKGITIHPLGETCLISIKEDDNLSGERLIVRCASAAGHYLPGELALEVT